MKKKIFTQFLSLPYSLVNKNYGNIDLSKLKQFTHITLTAKSFFFAKKNLYKLRIRYEIGIIDLFIIFN